MKIKTILIISIVIVFIFVIYLTTIDKKVYYLNLSDNYSNLEDNYSYYYKEYLIKEKKLEKYINDFDLNDYRITDLVRAIEDNKEVIINDKKQTIKNALIKADLITLSIGMNDINYKIGTNVEVDLYDYVDESIKDMELLFTLIRQYSKEDIVFIGLYNVYGSKYNKIFSYINDKLDALCNEYDIKFLDISDIIGNKKIDNKELDSNENYLIYEKLQKTLEF